MEKRPDLNKAISVKDFNDFYWYKEELLQFCRKYGLPQHGGKIELAKQIERFLQTGEFQAPALRCNKPKSKFDWNNELLSLETVITDNYKNTEQVRAFFIEQLGEKFRFNVQFMNWLKTASGKTLGEAVEKWRAIARQSRSNKRPKSIAPQFEYNTYIRDFLRDNPSEKRERAIACWKIKKLLRGHNKYRKADLELLQ